MSTEDNEALIAILTPIIMQDCMQTIAALVREWAIALPDGVSAAQALEGFARAMEGTSSAVFDKERPQRLS